MKLKYYLRGIGIGIIFSTIILTVAFQMSNKSDSKVNKSAVESDNTVNSVDNSGNNDITLDDLVNGKDVTPEDNKESTDTDVIEEKDSTPVDNLDEEKDDTLDKSDSELDAKDQTDDIKSEDSNGKGATDAEDAKDIKSEEPVAVEPTTEAPPTEVEKSDNKPVEVKSSVNTKKSIVVKSGMNSYEVSKLVKNAGLIDDAKDFDNYLTSNGYSRKIKTGTFHMNHDLSYEDMAKILTTK